MVLDHYQYMLQLAQLQQRDPQQRALTQVEGFGDLGFHPRLQLLG
ncbi:hypothetical protein [Pseudomonas sp. 24 E 1]|nr:hypothetical protein [Pseudomonas sp. 24 E 1]CRM56872.1 hypothetical protein [Pseudomonas sp. 58 R 12]CRM63847.1 hypothetical protein [Pseudomonas sp. 24 R 17]CRM73018.1 hypothetical protein [Pseudomonas sp. 35 E 8]CRM74806.1 hypothetical protein [Pseudomonas sp. 52 E 6]